MATKTWIEQLEAAVAADDRRVVAVVANDPAGVTGQCGLAVMPVGPEPKPDWYSGRPIDVRTFRWLGDCVARVCSEPGTRVIYAAELNAYGGSGNARKLGIGVGGIEGLLVDLNAIPPCSRVDIATATWRPRAGVNTRARAHAKARAIKLASERYTGGVDVSADAAEALLIAEVVASELAKFGVV